VENSTSPETVVEQQRIPNWLRRPARSSQETHELKRLLRQSKLNTVCEEARCPNISECFSRGTATFMILGDICTRGCRFCSVHTGKPTFKRTEFEAEARRLAEATKSLGLKHVVVTSVARDDLDDGGAEGFSLAIQALRELEPAVTIEVLVPDFRNKPNAIDRILDSAPDILNHNLETVPRLYRRVRPGASYRGSLELLQKARELNPEIATKTGIMLGLGETEEEVTSLMKDAVESGVSIFTAGQYMRPSKNHLKVEKYLSPIEFKEFEERALALPFRSVFIGPLVRSSYHADEFVNKKT
jgi:lipoic acid synthetase